MDLGQLRFERIYGIFLKESSLNSFNLNIQDFKEFQGFIDFTKSKYLRVRHRPRPIRILMNLRSVP